MRRRSSCEGLARSFGAGLIAAAGLLLAVSVDAGERGSSSGSEGLRHRGSYHGIGRRPPSAYRPFQSYQDYRRDLGPHSGFHDGEGGFQGYRERSNRLDPFGHSGHGAGLHPSADPAGPSADPPGGDGDRVGRGADLLGRDADRTGRSADRMGRGADRSGRGELLVPRYDVRRHRQNPLAGTSRQSRARRIFGEAGGSVYAEEVSELLEESGWTPLADGRTSEAHERFGELAERNPHLPLPRLGHALSSASLGDLEAGVVSMRQALRIDDGSFAAAPVDELLRERLGALVDRYPVGAGEEGDDFMRAALHYLRDEPEAAEVAVDLAIERGDRSESARRLKQLITERLDSPDE